MSVYQRVITLIEKINQNKGEVEVFQLSSILHWNISGVNVKYAYMS